MIRSLLLFLFLFPFAGTAGANDQPKAILVLGDSLSAAHNMPLDQGWVALLEQRLAADNCDATVVNASISGETSLGGVTRLPELLDRHQPSIVIIELGANDALRGLPLPQIRANLAQMVKSSRQAGARVVLAGIRIPTNYGRRYAEGFANIYPDLAEELGVPLVSFLLEGVALNTELMQADGLHPTAAAQSVLLENVYPSILPLLSWCAVAGSAVRA